MRRKGVSYDVGRQMGFDWRPRFVAHEVLQELRIIRDDLHCNAVRICGRNLPRLRVAGEMALSLGLEVWLSPELWDHDAKTTSRYIGRAARMIEFLRVRWPEKVVLCVGGETTLFSRGMIPGRTFVARMNHPDLVGIVKSGRYRAPLSTFLGSLVAEARKHYGGPLTYASLPWEDIDWGPFAFVGVDHYLTDRIRDRYVDMLRPAFRHGKPVVITEFGIDTAEHGPLSGGFLDSAGLKPSVIDIRSQWFHSLPILGKFVRPRMKVPLKRNETSQAERLVEQLDILEKAGVDGAFVFQFISQITPYDPNPRFDLDMASSSLVRYLEHGKGETYPELPWEPKESFRALSRYYASH